MVDKVNPNRKNRLSPKEVAKRSAALTLMLSTIACRLDDFKDLYLGAGIVLFIVGWNILGVIVDYFERKNPPSDSGGSSNDAPNGPSYVGGGDPEHKQ